MVFTEEHIKELKAAALPISHGSITIHIGAEARHLDIDVLSKLRLEKEPETKKAEKKISA